MKFRLLIVAGMFLVGCANQQSPVFVRQDTRVATADPNAIPQAKEILNYLVSLPSKPNQRLISGQMIWRHLGSSEYDYATFQNTYNATGHYPGIVGAGPTNNDDVLNQFVKDYSNKGGIVTMMFLARNAPQRWNWSGGSIDLAEMIRPGGENNDRYMQILDDTSLALQRYQDAGIVVLFRPYLEMNGSWSWFYGDHAKYIALWRHIFNYFTYVKGLHNLLWVYSPNGGVGDYLGYYPGDQYVDIVGLDWYQYNNGPMGKVGGYDELTSLGKPFAMTEYGPLDTSATAVDPQDYALFIQGIKQNMPKTVYWMAWSTPYGISNHSNIRAALNDPWVVNRDRIPGFSTTPPPPPHHHLQR
jgi:mannan endo-1,4-beta-mannosidase